MQNPVAKKLLFLLVLFIIGLFFNGTLQQIGLSKQAIHEIELGICTIPKSTIDELRCRTSFHNYFTSPPPSTIPESEANSALFVE